MYRDVTVIHRRGRPVPLTLAPPVRVPPPAGEAGAFSGELRGELRLGSGVEWNATGDPHNIKDRPTEEQTEGLADLLDSVGWNIYFASGAKDGDESPGEQVLRRFYTESGKVIDELADIGLPHLSHNLLKALEVLVPVDPRGVFFHVARVIRGGRKGGYQYDRMAEEVIVRIVDRYLADYRELFQTEEEGSATSDRSSRYVCQCGERGRAAAELRTRRDFSVTCASDQDREPRPGADASKAMSGLGLRRPQPWRLLAIRRATPWCRPGARRSR